MIDDQHDELAAQYAFGLLEGGERDPIESAPDRDQGPVAVRDLIRTAHSSESAG